MTASLIVRNGTVLAPPDIPVDRPAGTAVAVGPDGRIVAVGTDADVRALRGPGTEEVDAGGGLILPGFDDAHSHVLAGGAWACRLSLRDAETVDEVVAAVAAYADEHPELEWVIGGGWNYRTFPGGYPTAALLDRAVPDRPAIMVPSDGHSMWVNSVALRRAGIDRTTPDPPNGAIRRDAVTGEATGVLLERANQLVYRVVPERSAADYAPELDAAVAALHAKGFTAAQDPRTEYAELPAWTSARDEGRLALRTRLALMMDPEQTLAEWERTLDEHATRLGGFRDADWLDGGILKCFVDGVVETGTAAMLEPYGHAHEHGTGTAAFTDEQLTEFVVAADRRGWQVQMHAIGDRAVRMALDAVAAAERRNGEWRSELVRPATRPGRRHRVEHLEVVAPSDVARFARLGVVASIQPLHASIDPERLTSWLELLGPERTAWAWPTAQLAATGATVALGSDWPVVDFDPFDTLAAAVAGSNPDGSNALTLRQALHGYTHGAAVAAYAEDRRGSVRVGYDADLAVLDRDLLAEGASALAGTRVTATVVGGRVVHRA